MPGPQDRPLMTFDVFDTVLTRAVGAPRSVGYVLAERLRRSGVVAVSPEVFVEAHQRAEHLAYLRFGERRGTVHACAQLADLLGLEPCLAPVLEQAELDLELDLIRAVPGQLAAVADARATGAQVGFLSDTPLSRTAVEAMLRRAGVMQDGDLVWVSNELGAEKGTGRAYAAVVRELGRVPAVWQHRGDNRRSDVTMARVSGVTADWTPAASLDRYEQLLEASSSATAGMSSLMAGAARQARLALGHSDDPAGDARSAAVTGVIGPVLAALVLTALRRLTAGDVLVVGGAAASDLMTVAVPLVRAVRPDVTVVRQGPTPPPGRCSLISADVLTGQACPGPVDPLLLGVSETASGSARGWAFDERAGTGVTGESAAAVRGLELLLPCGHSGLGLFADALAAVLDLLPAGADLRAAVQAPLDAFWSQPSADEAQAWCATVPGLQARWSPGRRATASAPVRAAGRLRDRGRPVLHKLRRARLLAQARQQVTRR